MIFVLPWDMGDCCGRLRMNDCMICKCHLQLSQGLNGTTYQYSAIRIWEELDKYAGSRERLAEGRWGGNWQ